MLQWLSFIFLALVSAFFTTNLALELGTSPVEKIAITAGSIAIEFLKIYCLISANKAKRAVALYCTYAFVALYSLFASFGYALSTVDRVCTKTAVISNAEEVETSKKSLALMDDAITNLKSSIQDKRLAVSSMPEDRIYRKLELQKLINEDQVQIEYYIRKKNDLLTSIQSLQKDELTHQSVQKKTMYEVIGQTLGMNQKWVAFLVLAVFSISIELGIFISSPHGFITLEEDKKVPVKAQPKPKKPKKIREPKAIATPAPYEGPILESTPEPGVRTRGKKSSVSILDQEVIDERS